MEAGVLQQLVPVIRAFVTVGALRGKHKVSFNHVSAFPASVLVWSGLFIQKGHLAD